MIDGNLYVMPLSSSYMKPGKCEVFYQWVINLDIFYGFS